jgi:hypothetical protein
MLETLQNLIVTKIMFTSVTNHSFIPSKQTSKLSILPSSFRRFIFYGRMFLENVLIFGWTNGFCIMMIQLTTQNF